MAGEVVPTLGQQSLSRLPRAGRRVRGTNQGCSQIIRTKLVVLSVRMRLTAMLSSSCPTVGYHPDRGDPEDQSSPWQRAPKTLSITGPVCIMGPCLSQSLWLWTLG